LLNYTVSFGGLPHLSSCENLFNAIDSGFDLALLFFGGMVATVFLQVTFFTSFLNPLGDISSCNCD
jgi:hypothetical protein